MPTKRETDAAQKRQERLKLLAKLNNKGLARERDLHWIVEEELLRCELCGKNQDPRQTALHDRETGRLVGQNLRQTEREEMTDRAKEIQRSNQEPMRYQWTEGKKAK